MEWLFPVYNYTEKQLVNFRISNIFSGAYLKAFQEFIHYYVPDVVAPYALKYPRLKPRNERICRFCKKREPEVSFKNEAHVIPQFLGNKYLIHDIECDSCNLMFSKYESSFADSIGLLRTTDAIRGRRGVPKFKSDGLIAYPEKDDSGKYTISIEISDSAKTTHNKEDDTILLRTNKNPYIPLYIMKSLFKISYSLLNEDELDGYLHVEKIITTSEFDNKLTDYCKVLIFSFQNYSCNPFAITFKKRPSFENMNIPTKVVLLYFGRFVYEFIFRSHIRIVFEE